MSQDSHNRHSTMRKSILSAGIVALALMIWIMAPSQGFAAPVAPAALECQQDSEGANADTSQKDLTQICVDYATSPLLITWNWDEVNMGPGANTADGCALFDTDNDGLVNYALCNSWLNEQVKSTGYPILYSCTDLQPYNCSGFSVVSAGTTTCTIANDPSGPFTGGTADRNDTQSSCSIDTSVMDPTAKLLDVCSYPSASPTSAYSDCVIISNTKANLNVLKDVQPNDDGSQWDITITGPSTVSDEIGDGESTGINPLIPGAYTITESAVSPAVTNHYDSTWACTKGGSPWLSGNGTTISLTGANETKANDNINCTFINKKKASITVEKVTKNLDGVEYCALREFSFTFSGVSESFKLRGKACTDLDPSLISSAVFYVSPGEYSVSETNANQDGWALDPVTCTGGTWPETPAGTVGGSVAYGDVIFCRFVNNQESSLAVDFAAFTVDPSAGGAILSWETVSETNNAGFNVYRGDAATGPWTKVNKTLIAAKAPGSTEGNSYQWTDATASGAGTFWYALEDVALDGVATMREPVSVVLTGPNVVALNGFGAASAGWPALAGLLGLVAVAIGGFALRKND